MGICLVTSLTEQEWARACGSVEGSAYPSRNAPTQLKAHPAPSLAKPRITYHDPAKPRPLADIRAAMQKKAESLEEWEGRDKCRAQHGRGLTEGWRILATDGIMALGEPGAPIGPTQDRPQLMQHIRPIGMLPREAWRDYAPVRPFANEQSKAIYWTFEAGRVRFHTHGQPDLGEGSSWHPGAFSPAEVCLADTYLWLCRGSAWQISIADGPAIILTDPEQTTQIVVMGMRI